MLLKYKLGFLSLVFLLFSSEFAYPDIPIYSIVGGGIGYRDYIIEDSEYNIALLSPYFEFGAGNYRRYLLGLNGAIVLDAEDTSRIKQFQLGVQLKLYIVPRILYFGIGTGVHIESEEETTIESSENESVTIENPRFFYSTNVSLGVTIEVIKKRCLLIETSFIQTVRDPYPFSANIMMGILAFY